MEHGSLEIKESFEVAGFSVNGKVLDQENVSNTFKFPLCHQIGKSVFRKCNLSS